MIKNVGMTILSLSLLLLLSSCNHSNQTWEDMKTAGRHINRGINAFFGKNSESCLVNDDSDFLGPDDQDFIPLSDRDLKEQYRATDLAMRQSKLIPGKAGSGIPSLDHFQDPDATLMEIFKNIHFETDDHIIRNRQDLAAIQKMATYLKKNPKVFLCIEGHCDERASAAYNMALGTRRSNQVRALLIKQGVDLNRLYSVSFGKEKPIAFGHSMDDWKMNRRAQFKIFEKK